MESKEEFKDIPGFENYMVSNFGRVKSKARNVRGVNYKSRKEVLKPIPETMLSLNSLSKGYPLVRIINAKECKTIMIHRLVANVFIPNPENLSQVNHIDGNKQNNNISNLAWCNAQENHKHAKETGLKAKGSGVGTSKLTEAKVRKIKYILKKGGVTHAVIAKKFGVHESTISLIFTEKFWKHIIV